MRSSAAIAPRSASRAGRALLALLPLVIPAVLQAGAAEDIAAGDAAFSAGDLARAHGAWSSAVRESPRSYAALWRLSRAESDLGEDAAGEERKRLVASAVEHAREAVKAAPDSAMGHLQLAAALGRQALKEGPKTKLALAREIKSEVDRALQIDPALGRGWHVLASWNRELASINALSRLLAKSMGGVPPGASMENAVNDFGRAIELEPAYVNHRLELGRTYVMLHRREDARRELEKALALAPTSHPRDAKYQQEARELLRKLR